MWHTLIYIHSAPNNSNETYTLMCMGRAGRFGLAHTINRVCHSIRSMFRVLGMYNFGRKVKNIGGASSNNVWFAKKDTKGSSVLLLWLVSFFANQTLGEDNLPSSVRIGLNDLKNIGGGGSAPPPPPGPPTRHHWIEIEIKEIIKG